MLKKLFVCLSLILILITTGCGNSAISRIRLDDKYYTSGEFIKVSADAINSKTNENYVLYTYNSYCSFQVPCDKIFEEIMKKYKIDFLSIPFEEFKNTSIYKKVKYAPSVIIVNNGKVNAYLNAESDEDLNKYQSASEFESWLEKYIYLTL